LQSDTTHAVRWALGLLRRQVDDLLLAALTNPLPQVRINAMEALHVWSADAAASILADLVRDPDLRVQQAAKRNSSRLEPFRSSNLPPLAEELTFEGKPVSYWLDQYRWANTPRQITIVTNDAVPTFTLDSAFFDFLDLNLSTKKLINRSDPISELLSDRFPDEDWDLLVSATTNPSQKRSAFIRGLNSILASGSILYSTNAFAGVKLSPETIRRMSNNPAGTELARVNRMLLDDAGV
jgi:hypothetical protein